MTLKDAAAVVVVVMLAGQWTLDSKRSDDVNRAIEATVKKMNFVTRPIARSRLRKTNPAYASIALAFTGDEARITAGSGRAVVLPASGAPVRWKRSDGEVFTVSGKLQNGTYIETFDAKDGRRTNTFSLTPDGALKLQVTVTSPRLPSPLRYTLMYRR
jgi:hypothetical protein